MQVTAPRDPESLARMLRSRGLRMTPQRGRILEAVADLGHATPEAVAESVRASCDPAPSLSTVYRTLETLEELGVLSHTHLDHGPPSYHLAAHADHIHLVCVECGAVQEDSMDVVEPLAQRMRERHGFVVDPRHLTMHGLCARCAAEEAQA